MKSAIIGKALVVAWSVTLTNLGPTPQIIDLGAAPTVSDYVPADIIIRNVNESDANGLKVFFATNKKNITDIKKDVAWYLINIPQGSKGWNWGYTHFSPSGASIIPSDHDLYVEYSLPKIYPANNKPITIDILAYPTN